MGIMITFPDDRIPQEIYYYHWARQEVSPKAIPNIVGHQSLKFKLMDFGAAPKSSAMLQPKHAEIM